MGATTMNIGECFVASESSAYPEQQGDVVLCISKFTKQETYKERHRNDFSSKPLWYRIFDTFKPAIILCAICVFLFQFVIMNGFIPSESMQPTLKIGDGIVVNRLSYINDGPLRGDVVVFVSDEYDGEYLIKRVIGLPGDVIDIKNGSCYVNGCRLVESYAVGNTEVSPNKREHFVVPEDEYFLLGDNRESSADSRWWVNPYINKDSIIGKAVFQYSLDFIENGLYANTVKAYVPEFVNDNNLTSKNAMGFSIVFFDVFLFQHICFIILFHYPSCYYTILYCI